MGRLRSLALGGALSLIALLAGRSVEDAAAQWGSQYDLTVEWELSAGDRLPEGQTIEGIINGLGVTLPHTVPAPPRLRRVGHQSVTSSV